MEVFSRESFGIKLNCWKKTNWKFLGSSVVVDSNVWFHLGLYPILDLDFCKKENLNVFELPKVWMEYPDLVPWIQIRAKNVSPRELDSLVKTLLDKYPTIPWILNDYWKEAIRMDCFGAHVGKEDYESLNEEEKISLRESKLFLGTSSHTIEEVNTLDSSLWNYTGLGPIFSTENKDDAKSAIGTESLTKLSRSASLPVTLIGGIQVSNLDRILDQGSFLLSSISMVCLEEEFRAAAEKIRARKR
ncbi:thiamine phosphate synthase [Leptospira adleri]|uniref:Thiamine phosphate synthase n=1 Tax=Leptospira adleri TaxID=2023186 RepID=A0A2M9YUI4_9LEPT|nr:thiamine phosphate synthase [Leptospira adleri]PJZ55160.1 thiamine phosphate synthase [Leptospira adleri]PJZ63456.1 thiamine phosphate synthase [Leptospira adleri]